MPPWNLHVGYQIHAHELLCGLDKLASRIHYPFKATYCASYNVIMFFFLLGDDTTLVDLHALELLTTLLSGRNKLQAVHRFLVSILFVNLSEITDHLGLFFNSQ